MALFDSMHIHATQRLDSWDLAELVSGFAHLGTLPPGIVYDRIARQITTYGRNMHRISTCRLLEAMRKLPYAPPPSFDPNLYGLLWATVH